MDYDIVLHVVAGGLVLSGWVLLIAFWLQFRSDCHAHSIYQGHEKRGMDDHLTDHGREWPASPTGGDRRPGARGAYDPGLSQRLSV
ncbi:MAG TPA: hypothetical protein VK473_07010 [Terriglobales bacterium]|nr:hypothetical protein [Terriglobales bacterium]